MQEMSGCKIAPLKSYVSLPKQEHRAGLSRRRVFFRAVRFGIFIPELLGRTGEECTT